jgi:hypothetical protein
VPPRHRLGVQGKHLLHNLSRAQYRWLDAIHLSRQEHRVVLSSTQRCPPGQMDPHTLQTFRALPPPLCEHQTVIALGWSRSHLRGQSYGSESNKLVSRIYLSDDLVFAAFLAALANRVATRRNSTDIPTNAASIILCQRQLAKGQKNN